MHLDVRPARFEDLEDLREIERLAGQRFREVGLDAVADDEPLSIDSLAQYADAGRAWVAVDDADRPVGYILIDEVDGLSHIEQLTVRPDWQGHGLARALIFEGVQAAYGAGRSPSLTLTTFDQVPWNRPLFERLGFRVLAEHEIGDELRAVRQTEAERGLDPTMRVAMLLDLEGWG